MSSYADYFLNSRMDAIQLDLFEFSHPDFSVTYRVVRQEQAGVDVTLEDGSSARFDYYPVGVTALGATDDMDTGIRIQFADLGEVVPVELDRVNDVDGWSIKPTVRYRTYRSDDLSEPLFGPIDLEVAAMAFDETGVVFDAQAPRINASRTGERYTLERFPMLRGTL